MIGFCSSQGVTNDDGDIVSELFPNEAQAGRSPGREEAITTPVRCAFCVAQSKPAQRRRRCHLMSYQEDGALLQELFSHDAVGAQV
ncbi:hypothetical protein ACNKHL_17090 [Shigella flexneri]